MKTTKKKAMALALFLVAFLPGSALSQDDANPVQANGLHALIESGGDSLYLPLVVDPQSPAPVSLDLTPFDVNATDLNGPASWNANYGKTPEIVVASNGATLDVDSVLNYQMIVD